MALIDIFKPQKSVIADGLEGKIMLIYGKNNLGKTYQATRMPKPFVFACENGLNGIDGIPYYPITKWSEFTQLVQQFTNPRTRDKAKELYSTIIIDEVYASAQLCQNYIIETFGAGGKSLADGDGKHNLYQLYEKEYFNQINALTNSGFTIVFIAHEETKDGYTRPKGDKRSIDPIIDKSDYVIYLQGNGVDEDYKVIKSSAYLAATDTFFARSRFEYVPVYLPEFTAESLTDAIQVGIDKKRQLDGAKIVSFEEQSELNKGSELNYETLKSDFNRIVSGILEGVKTEVEQNQVSLQLKTITEKYLGSGGKFNQCTPNQVQAMDLIIQDIKQTFSVE